MCAVRFVSLKALILACVTAVLQFATDLVTANSTADITSAPAKTWLELAGTSMIRVAYQWPPSVTATMNGIGVAAVIGNWSGGAYDTKRDRLVVWGGGHFAYAGNEIYAFDMTVLRWARINDPSLSVDTDYRAGDEVYADGTPRSNHSYGALQYVPTIDRFCSFGTAANFPASRGGPTTWAFNFAASKWERKSPAPSFGFGTSSAWDPVTRHIWIRVNGKEGLLAQWDPAKDNWVIRGRRLEHKTWYEHSAAIDPIGRRYVAVGGGKVRAYDLSRQGEIPQEDLRTSGPQNIVMATNPGFEYDPVIDKFVGWNGGGDIFTLDPVSLEWQRIVPATSNRVVAAAAARNGTFGRFRYVPSRNVYIVVSDVRQNVFIYKLSDLGHAKIPPRLQTATRSPDSELAAWASVQIKHFSNRRDQAN